MRGTAFLSLAVGLFLAWPAASAAQVRGVVTDATARPLPGVLVELWSYQVRLAGQVTDASGRFYLPVSGTGPRAILARGIGLVPVRRTLAASETVLTLVMQPQPVQVEAVTVEAQETACPRRDDPHARAVWERAASRYDVSLSAFGAKAHALMFSANVPAESLGVIDTTQLHEDFSSGAYSLYGFQHRRQQERGFYAFQMSGFTPPRFVHWQYPLIESVFAWHFADSTFGEWNRFALLESASGDIVIGFCSRKGNRPYIKGVLRLAADTTLASANWTFVTPEPREQVGGQVYFNPVDPGRGGQAVVPIAGLFWRRQAGGVYEEWMEYRRWELCDSANNCSVAAPQH